MSQKEVQYSEVVFLEQGGEAREILINKFQKLTRLDIKQINTICTMLVRF
jgi:hypothetical protein